MEVPKSPAGVCPLLAGMEIPTATLTAEDGGEFNLREAVRQKPAVLVFYRGSW
jgi:peroxiredoxin